MRNELKRSFKQRGLLRRVPALSCFSYVVIIILDFFFHSIQLLLLLLFARRITEFFFFFKCNIYIGKISNRKQKRALFSIYPIENVYRAQRNNVIEQSCISCCM